MKEESCKLCGYLSRLGTIEKHHIVPTEVTEQAGMPHSPTIRLCANCHREIHTWYSMKVAKIAYQPESKRFELKPFSEQIKDYKSVFNTFKKHKTAVNKKGNQRPSRHLTKKRKTPPSRPVTLDATSGEKNNISSSNKAENKGQLRLSL